MHSHLLRCLRALALLGAALPGVSAAQSPTPMAEWQLSAGVALIPYFLEEIPKWQGAVAVGAVVLPEYEGASENRVVPIAAAELRYRNRAYLSSSEGAGINVLQGKSYRIGAAVGFDIGRFENRDPRLKGLGDLDSAAELKFYGEKVLFPFVLRSTVRHTLDGSTGWLADFAFYLPVAGNKKFFVLAGPSVTLASQVAMQRRFGVTPEQAANSAFPEYRAGAGFRNASVGFSANYFIDDHWFLNATGSVQRLLGDAADSPITDRDTQSALIVIGGYRW